MKKTTLFLLLTICSTFLSNAQTSFTWEEQNIDPIGNPEYGVLELVAKDQYSLWGLLYKSGDLLGANDAFIRSADGGDTWNKVVSPHPDLYVNGLASVDSLTAYYIMSDWQPGDATNHVVKTMDGGEHWDNVFTPDSTIVPTHIYFFNANEGILVCDPLDGYWSIYKTTNAGQNWTRVIQDSIHSNPLPGEFGGTFIFDAEGDKYWFLTGKGMGSPCRVFYSPNKGASWYAGDTINSTVSIQTAALTFRDGENGLVRCNEELFKTTNHGMTWAKVTVNSGTMFTYDMCHVPGTNMYISTGGDTASFGHSRNGIGTSYTIDDGTTWHIIDTAVHHSAIIFTGIHDGWTGSINREDGTGGAYRAAFQTTGIAETRSIGNLDVTAYPNPVSDRLTIRLNTMKEGEIMQYAIIDLAGKTVHSATVINGSSIDMGGFNPGMYLLSVSGSQSAPIRFIKQ